MSYISTNSISMYFRFFNASNPLLLCSVNFDVFYVSCFQGYQIEYPVVSRTPPACDLLYQSYLEHLQIERRIKIKTDQYVYIHSVADREGDTGLS